MKKVSFLLSLLFSFGLHALCQTSGPATPETQKFTPGSVNQMVNLFTGDLNYNINLLEMDGGYPINLSYSSGNGMTEEAGCVGLGWQLNIGRINRMVRGLPDDFKGDKVTRVLYQKKDWNIGIGAGFDVEFLGFPLQVGVGATSGLTFSNMRGVDIERNLSAGISTKSGDMSLSAGLNLGMSSNEGASLSPNAGLQFADFKIGISGKINSMEGVKYLGITANSARLNINTNLNSFPLLSAKTPFTPKIDFPTSNLSGSFKFRLGSEIWGASVGGQVYGQFSVQSNPVNTRDLNAYGYLYLQNQQDKGSIMDLGSEKEGPVFEEDRNLYLSYLANDIYSVSAQGLSGNFRPFRTDIGIAHNENLDGNDFGGSLGAEAHFAAYTHAGIDITANIVNTYSGEWRNNTLSAAVGFKESVNNEASVYFKSVGETNGFLNRGTLTNLGGLEPVKFNIGESALFSSMDAKNTDISKATKSPESRNSSFQYLTADEAYSLQKPLSSYSGHFDSMVITELARENDKENIRKPDHISSITITKDDGMVYEFGIAAYNTTQKEVTFSVAGKKNENDIFRRTTTYDPAIDNTPQNNNGRTNYYSYTKTPSYAYAYLLTAVYSPDYVDLTGDGPTPDDFGSYTKFNYTLATQHFKWRTPYNDANYNPGALCDKKDDMASYLYGEKEIWVIHSIETKNYIADFYTFHREDAYEVLGENGGRGVQQLSKIDSIKLYSRAEYFSKLRNAIPIKSIFFEYADSLSANIPANGNHDTKSPKGKLALGHIYFSYGKSEKGKNSYYSFAYNNLHVNYDEEAVDRWGTYKSNVINDAFNNIRFPYSEQQDRTKANTEAAAWNLNRIALPTGGEIKIDYEAKDYAFVQDKPAMQMYKVAGFLNGTDITNKLYDGDPNLALLVDPGPAFNEKSALTDYYKQGEKVFIDCMVSIGTHSGNELDNEEVNGYFDADSFELIEIKKKKYIKINLTPVNNTNPLARALWQKMRKTLTHILHAPVVDPDNDLGHNIISVVNSIPSSISSVLAFFKSYETQMKNDQRGMLLDNQSGSFVRLYNPSGIKNGGGNRVKRITITDNWNAMTNGTGQSAVYGQEYNYEKEIITDKGSKKISSGVATYEPIGNEENPFMISAGDFNNANALAPELYYSKNEPFGESFFPAASIGYSKVTVRDIHDEKVIHNTTGSETYEYYTAKDFPTITKRTIKEGFPSQVSSLFYSEKKYTASQGFYIELNDMHGKLKSQKTFSATDSVNPVSGAEYKYVMRNGKLDNTVPTVNSKTGLINTHDWVGLDYDFNVTTTESRSVTHSPALQINLDVIPAVFGIPLPLPTFLPSYTESVLQFKGITTTKVIYRTGLVSEIIAYQNGAEQATKNILYDASGGEVLVTGTMNEFNEPIYSTKLPAHWFYEGMGFASDNINKSFKKLNIAAIGNDPSFCGGDELLLWKDKVSSKGWVYENSDHVKTLINEKGDQFTTTLTFDYVKIIRSGKKNMQSLMAGEVISKADPTTAEKLKFTDIIGASAAEFKEHWQTYYGLHPFSKQLDCNCTKRVFSPNGMELEFRDDGTVKSPRNASIDGSLIILKNDSCGFKIQLDRGLSNLPPCNNGYTIKFGQLVPLVSPGFCSSTYTLKGDYSIVSRCDQKTIQKGNLTIEDLCQAFQTCTAETTVAPKTSECVIGQGISVNPYLLGILGNWHEKTSYKYITTRKYNPLIPAKDQGVYNDFNLCLDPVKGFEFDPAVCIDKSLWQPVERTEIFDPYGRRIETASALEIPKTQLFGYGYTIPVAAADNAAYYEVGVDGFEDYDYLTQTHSSDSACDLPAHFKFTVLNSTPLHHSTGLVSGIIDSTSHTGLRSLFIPKDSVVSLSRDIIADCNFPISEKKYGNGPYILDQCDIIKPFSPIPGKVYMISLWINEIRTIDQLDESSGMVKVTFLDAANAPTGDALQFRATGPIIDNWQQLNEKFNIPDRASKIRIELASGKSRMFIDDVRVQPFNASMKTFVYNPVNLRLMAVLDENNFATFYEYDDEGQLTRNKKETERGIMTIQEIRSAKPKTDKLK